MADFQFENATDTVLREFAADTSFGSNTLLGVSNVAGDQAQSLVQFDIFGAGAGQIAAGTQITSATLTFEVTDSTGQTIALHQMLTAWDDTATWNSLTGGISTDGIEAAATADATAAGAGLGPLTFDVTSGVQSWSDGSANNGWAILSDSILFEVQSSENTIRPVLNITTADTGASSGTVSFEQGNNGYTGVSDTYIRENRLNKDYSTSAKVYSEGSEPGGGEMQALLEFDDIFGTGPGQIPLGALITSATLEFDIGDGTGDQIQFYEMQQAWSDAGTLTWNSFGNGIQTNGIEAASSAAINLAGGINNGPQIIDVTSSLQNWSDGSENNGWVIRSSGENIWRFASSESGNGPKLNVTYDNSGTPQPDSGTLTFEQGEDGYLATEDTYIRESRASNDYSFNTKVYIEGSEPDGGEMQALLSFGNLFGAGLSQIPLGSTITSAVLELDIGDGTSNPISLNEMLIDWTGFNQKTWNAFGNGIQKNGTEASSTAALTLPAGVSAQIQSFDVTSSLQNWSDGAANNGWLLTSAGENLWRFASSESDSAPVLRVTYDNTNTPQPTSGTYNFAQGVDGYFGVDDTYVRESRSTSDYTTRAKVYIEGSEPDGGEMQALLSFGNLFGGGMSQIPLGSNIASATLEFEIGDGTNDAITFHNMLLDWTAFSQKTWDAYGNGIQTDGVEATVNPSVNLPTGISNGIQTVDVTASLQAWSDGAANNGWLISSSGDNIWRFASSESGNGPVLSVTFTDEVLPPQPPDFNPTFVAVHDTLLYNADDPTGFGSGDPSGVAYVPGLDRLFIVDSEHDENPYFSPINLFVVEPDGTYDTAYSLTGFTTEPTGIAYNPADGNLYITDDDDHVIYVVNPTNPTVAINTIDLDAFGLDDAEDPVFDPATGNLLVVDGTALTLFELTVTGALVGTKTFPAAVQDVEGFTYDAENEMFFVASGTQGGTIYQLDRDLNIVDASSFLDIFTNAVTGSVPRIKGLEFAPSSDPNDGDEMSLYVTDYGYDQVADGRLFEIDPYDDFNFA